MSNTQTAEAVVIGGGAIGTAVACYLAMDGVDVTLIERGEFAWGSSRRCEGHVVTYDTPPGDFSLFCKTGQNLFYEAQNFLSVDFDFSPEGIGLLVDDESQLETVKTNYEGKKKEGYDVTLWDRNDLRHHEPNIGDNVIACLNFNNDCTVNPMRLCFGLAEHARTLGATILPRTQVTSLHMQNGRVSGVETDKGLILTKNVILSTGVWTPQLGAMLGVNVPIRPRQGHILVTERVTGLLGKAYVEYGYLLTKHGLKREKVTPDMDKFGVAFVAEPSSAGTVLMGSSRRFVGMDIRPNPAVMRAVAERGAHFFPAFSDMRLLRCYAGVRPATADELPIISTTHIPGLFIGAGHEGLGISLSLITGKIMSELVRGQTPFIDIGYMSIDRFGFNPPSAPVGEAMM